MFRSTSSLPVAAAAMVAATVLAACGSSSPDASNSRGSSQLTAAQMQQDGDRFAGCMRSHRVSNFPDATDPRAFKTALDPNSTEAHSPAFQSAYAACRHLLPNDGVPPPNQAPAHSRSQIAAMLAFARCVRSHGFTSFPDPTSSGDLTHEMIANAGITLNQPATLRVGDACTSVTHGYITKAAVARFVAGR